MTGEFNIEFTYLDKAYNLPARLIRPGYIIKLEIELEGVKVYFEPDADEKWRIFADITGKSEIILPDPALLETISNHLTEKLK